LIKSITQERETLKHAFIQAQRFYKARMKERMLQLHFTSRRMIIISSSSYILLRWWSSQKRERERETKREKLLQPKPLWISWVVGRINKKPSLQTFLLG